MQTDILNVRGVHFGAGKPKICVPIVERNRETILSFAEKALDKKPDLLELRVDWFEGLYNIEAVISLLKDLTFKEDVMYSLRFARVTAT